jgi:Group II intron, maturase-specific domain
VRSLRGVAKGLTARGVKTARGGAWTAVQVTDVRCGGVSAHTSLGGRPGSVLLRRFLAGCNSRVASCRVRTAARMFNNHIRGWINYYGRFYKSALYPALRHIDRILARWAHRKFKSLSGRHVAARPAALGFFFISL